jgi:regulator of sigma D
VERTAEHDTQQNVVTPLSAESDERRARMAEAIEQLIERRREVMVAYCDLAGLERYEDAGVVHPKLRKLCQSMMDYTALGHFEIYERILSGNERRTQVRDIAVKMYPPLADTTDILVDFNDNYDVLDERDSMKQLAEDLSRLGETFAARIELEDRILAALGRPVTPNDA